MKVVYVLKFFLAGALVAYVSGKVATETRQEIIH